MKLFHLPIEIPEGERTPLVNRLVNLVVEQQEIIEKQQQKIAKLEEKVNSFTHFSSTNSKSRSNYLRILRGTAQDFVLNEYSRSYLEKKQLPVCHLSKLKFDSQIISRCDREWNEASVVSMG